VRQDKSNWSCRWKSCRRSGTDHTT